MSSLSIGRATCARRVRRSARGGWCRAMWTPLSCLAVKSRSRAPWPTASRRPGGMATFSTSATACCKARRRMLCARSSKPPRIRLSPSEKRLPRRPMSRGLPNIQSARAEVHCGPCSMERAPRSASRSCPLAGRGPSKWLILWQRPGQTMSSCGFRGHLTCTDCRTRARWQVLEGSYAVRKLASSWQALQRDTKRYPCFPDPVLEIAVWSSS
mmetsp:Transcript_3680/g.7862  ORF Transcript_3680/g.7862 Transcript_3680/m.7862 type:complete len:212 (-) Transcript_3680:164-799(-)